MEHYEVGLYRENTGIVIAAGAISDAAMRPIASNCHANLRNHPSADDAYTLGFEFVHVTTCVHGGAHAGAYIAAQITSVTGAIATLSGAGWNGDTVTIGYYAKGTSPAYGNMAIKDDDIWRAEHLDSAYSALDTKGHIAPTEAGYVYDIAMASQTNVQVLLGLSTFVSKYETSSMTGNWSFTNDYPYYVTAVRVECKASSMESGKGIAVRMYEGATQVSFGAGGNDIVVNDTEGWWVTSYNDGVDEWYVANIYLGMLYSNNLYVKVSCYNGNLAIPAGDVRVFVAGWHMPDPVPEYSSVLWEWAALAQPHRIGMYRVDSFIVSATNRITVSPTIAIRLTGDLRTAPHFLNEFRNGVEYVKNITTGDYITSAITGMSDSYIDLNAAAASENDVVEVGYYTARNVPTTPLMDAGDLVRREDIDGLEAALAQLDRVDFGKATFPYGDGEYEWNDRLWQQYSISTQDSPQYQTIGTAWTTVLSFDAVSYNSRKTWDEYKDPVTLRDTYSIDETPFYLTGIVVKTDGNGVSGGIRRNDRIAIRISVNGTTLRQGGGTVLYYYPIANSKNFGTHLAPLRLDTDDIMDGTGHMFYIPLGIVRAYSFKVDLKVEAATAFTTIGARAIAVEGFIIDEV